MPMQVPMPGMSGLEQLQTLMSNEAANYPQRQQAAQSAMDEAGRRYIAALGNNPHNQNDLDAQQLAAFGQGLAGKPGDHSDFAQALLGGLSSYENALMRQREYKNTLEKQAAQQAYAIAQGGRAFNLEELKALAPVGGIAGMMRSGMVTARVYAQQREQLQKTFYDKLASQHDPDAYEKSIRMADESLARMGVVPEPGGLPGAAQPSINEAAPFTIGSPPAGDGAPPDGPTPAGAGMDPATQVRRLTDALSLLKDEKDRYEAAGNYAAAGDVQKTMDSYQKQIATLQGAPSSQKPTPQVGGNRYAPDPANNAAWKASEEQASEFQKHYGKMAETYQAESDQANTTQIAYKETLKALNAYIKAGGTPSTLAPYKVQLQNGLRGIGVDLGEQGIDQLTAAEIIKKMNAQLGGQFAKSINNSRATQLEVQLGMRSSPGLEMPENASREILEYFNVLAKLSKLKADTFADWRSKFPNADPLQFTAYWNLYNDHPDLIQRFSPSKIQAYSQQFGKSPVEVIGELRKRYEGLDNAK